ncbi:MAG: hypothetical protein IH848_10105 [Acidobacteria bacterium]|nr:hypothetical protein [Acidobacteriota bacterium]
MRSMSFARLITRERIGLGGDPENLGMLSVKRRPAKIHVHELLGSID